MKVKKRVKVKTMDRVYQHQWKAHQKDQEKKKKRFYARNQSKIEASDYLSKTLGNLTDAIKDDSSQLLVEFLRESTTRQERRDKMFMAMMQRFIMGPPPHMQQPSFDFGTSNNIDIQGSFCQTAPVYGTNSATFSPIWPSTCTTTATSNNSTSGDVLDHFLHKTRWYSYSKMLKYILQLKFVPVKYILFTYNFIMIILHYILFKSFVLFFFPRKVSKDSLMAVAVLSPV